MTVIEPQMLSLGYCCNGERRRFLPVPLACNGPRCGGLIARDADYHDFAAPPKEYGSRCLSCPHQVRFLTVPCC